MALVYEKRKAVVEYCITHGKNYKLTAACFGFTYQQVYGWVQRYHKAGLEELDGGHRSSSLAAENQRLRMNSLELEMKISGTAEIPVDLLAQKSEAGLQRGPA